MRHLSEAFVVEVKAEIEVLVIKKAAIDRDISALQSFIEDVIPDAGKPTVAEVKPKKRGPKAKYKADKSAWSSKGNGEAVADKAKRLNVKFTLHREFGLDDKEVNLMRSYLHTWRATGRLDQDECKRLDAFAFIRLPNLKEGDRAEIRHVFYGCRDRVMTKTKALSSMDKKSVDF